MLLAELKNKIAHLEAEGAIDDTSIVNITAYAGAPVELNDNDEAFVTDAFGRRGVVGNGHTYLMLIANQN